MPTKIMELFQKLISKKSWGTVTIRFQNGLPVMVSKTTTMKLKSGGQ